MQICVTISAYNEEKSIGLVINDIPEEIQGHDVRVIVVDDGSTDNTIAAVKNCRHREHEIKIVSHKKNMGLGVALKRGLIEAISIGADIIVHIDADYQYLPSDIEKLITPILNDEADLVLGSRFENLKYKMPRLKYWGNKFVSLIVRKLVHQPISDAQTGFRALKRDLAELLGEYLQGTYTYTQEMIIHTAFNGFRIKEVPVVFQQRYEGPSRLIQSIWSYFSRVIRIGFKTYKKYKPGKLYLSIALFFLLIFIAIIVGIYINPLSNC